MPNQRLEDIHTVVIHCSATPAGMFVDADWINQLHVRRGWSGIGYHDVILLDGMIEQGRPYTRRGAHVEGNNLNTIGVCMVGGLDSAGRPADTYFRQQWDALHGLLWKHAANLPNLVRIVGHRDYSPDLNGDGLIAPNEWIKACPCFDVKAKLSEFGLARYGLPAHIDISHFL